MNSKFVLGDFNAIIGENGSGKIGRFGLGVRIENGDRLEELLWSTGLVHGNSQFRKKMTKRWTWRSANGQTKSEIDHILTNRKWSLFNVGVVPSFITGSDHRLLRATAKLDKKLEKKILHRPAKSKQQAHDYSLFSELIGQQNWPKIDDINEDYGNLVRTLKELQKLCRLPPVKEERISEETKKLLKMRTHLKKQR
ncbi:hypothetical protein OESDEN_03705 [Oesophagostomum dentatum]|uniref:Endonuclease/exonuclease/phosphatase domain-containing protein n=1 Tax=Oesophagostomum dentatum TaxID=61180 RepID=A0A0B1TLQ0_OESDE|nr:hypothetical protein OESDEN_03705 [Oesophagostomum dentatum]